MTIHGPGSPIYMSEIQAEFGGGNPMYLSNYYAGGPFVPAGTVGSYGAIPSSGAISLQNFYGASNVIDTDTLVAGRNYAPGFWDLVGYGSTSGFGTMTDGVFAPFGMPWEFFCENDLNNTFQATFHDSAPNSGWERFVVNGSRTFRRDQARYISGGPWGWQWDDLAALGGPVFGNGGTYEIKFYGS